MLDASSSQLTHAAQNFALIALSLVFLPLDTFILGFSILLGIVRTQWAGRNRRAIRSPRTAIFYPKTVLVTGVGMTKGLALARLFYAAGHDVIGADFEPALLPLAAGRTSRSLNKFCKLAKPIGPQGSTDYINSIIEIVKRENVDIWVSCSGVASAIEDGMAKEAIEAATNCKAVQFDVATTKRLHEKHSFIEYTKSINLPVPDTHTITSKAAALKVLDDAAEDAKVTGESRKHILKYIGTDDSLRGDMTLLPFPTPAATKSHISRLPISEDRPWILQQYIAGPEYCTHALVVRGEVKAFVACPSAELLMHYEALDPNFALSQAMLRFTQEYAAAGGPSFTGHLSFDFLVEQAEADAAKKDPSANIKLYPIECNPRAHTAVALFNHTPEMAEAYMTLLTEPSPAKQPDPAKKSGLTNGLAPQPIFPHQPTPAYCWFGHDLVEFVLLPLLSLLSASGPSFTEVFDSVGVFVEHVLHWKDGTFELWDPWPAWWLYHVYWPVQFALAVVGGKKWSRVNPRQSNIRERYIDELILGKQWLIEITEATFWHHYPVLPATGLRSDLPGSPLILRPQHITRISSNLDMVVKNGNDIMLAFPKVKRLHIMTTLDKIPLVFPYVRKLGVLSEQTVDDQLQRNGSHALHGLLEVIFFITIFGKRPPTQYLAGSFEKHRNIRTVIKTLARSLMRAEGAGLGSVALQALGADDTGAKARRSMKFTEVLEACPRRPSGMPEALNTTKFVVE